MGTYTELSNQTAVTLKNAGGVDTITYYVGNKNLVDNTIIGNVDKADIDYILEENDWITDVKFEKVDDTAKSITITYDAHDGLLKYWMRSVNLKLKNMVDENKFIQLRQAQRDPVNLKVYLCMYIPIKSGNVGASNISYCGFDKNQCTMKSITPYYVFPSDYTHVLFYASDRKCYYVNISSDNYTSPTKKTEIENCTTNSSLKEECFNRIKQISVENYIKDNLYIFKMGVYASTAINTSFVQNNPYLIKSQIINIPPGYIIGWLFLSEN